MLGHKHLSCLIDTGATINLIGEHCFRNSTACKEIKVSRANFDQATTANGLKIIGLAQIPLIIADNKFVIPMYIAKNEIGISFLVHSFYFLKKLMLILLLVNLILMPRCK